MNKPQFEKLLNVNHRMIKGADFEFDAVNGTLLLGYTADRYDFHVYLDENLLINVVIYEDDLLISHRIENEFGIEVDGLIPDKRIYPEKSSYIFCSKLLERGCSLSFTSYTDNISSAKYHGKVYEELSELNQATRRPSLGS